jgi:hypothetical protein
VIVSEFLLLDGPGQPWEAARRTDQTDSSAAAGRMPCFDDAGGALEWSNLTLVNGEVR